MSTKTKIVTFRKNAFLHNSNFYVTNPTNPKVIPFHKHEYGELVFILNGSVIHITEEGETKLEQGDVFVIEGEQAHGFKKLENLKILYVLFDLDHFNTLRNEFKGFKGFNVLFGLEPELRQNYNFRSKIKLKNEELDEISNLLLLYEKECIYNLPGKEDIIENYFKAIVILLCRYYSLSSYAKNDVRLKMEKAINYMKCNFAKPIKIEQLAQTAKMNISTFQRIFKQVTGYAPGIFLQHLRVNEAARILLTEKIKVKYAGKKAGFNNQSYFVKTFKRIIGITPQEYLDNI